MELKYPQPKFKLTPGKVSGRRAVPTQIVRPEYVDKRTAKEGNEPWVQSKDVIERVRVASTIAANALATAGKAVAPGVTTDQLDQIVHDYLIANNSYPSTLGYKGFPKSCCTSINETICHGIPDSTVLNDGDIVNIDVTAFFDGAHGDTNATFFVGEPHPELKLLVERTKTALDRAIEAVKPGRSLNVIGRVIETYAQRFNYGVVRDFTGHGIGETFHNGLIIFHFDEPRIKTIIEKDMVFTIEPMINFGTHEYKMWNDDWTVVTKDGSYSAQFEHTLVVTDNGAEILTLPTV